MPQVTGLGPAKRRSGWTEVQLDGALVYLLPDEEVLRLGLRTGAEIAAADLEIVRATAERAEALRIGLRYLSVRPRSRLEVVRRLRRDRMTGETIERTLDRLVELKYLDDADFAAAFARDRIRLRPCGARRMQSDLLSRGVSRSDAEAGIRAAMSEEDVTETELLERVASARAGRLTGRDRESARRRLFGYLARRGFSTGSVRAWLDAHWPDDGEDESLRRRSPST